MDKSIGIRISVETKAIQAQIAHFFDEQHKEINSVIDKEITVERVILGIEEAVQKELKLQIGYAIRNKIDDLVRNNKVLSDVIDRKITKVVESKFRK